MAATRTNPPFTRLTAKDADTNRVVQDLYDKLGALTQTLAPADPPADPPSAPSSNLRKIITSATLAGDDHTLSANIQSVSSVLLPPTANVIGKGPYIIHNETGSAASLSLGSSLGELVGGVPATSHILAPGASLTLQPHPGYWLTVGNGLSGPASGASSGTTAASPGTPSTPSTPDGNPSGGTFANAPQVTTLPTPPDPLAVVGQYVTYNGQEYVFTAPLTGVGAGFWAVSGATRSQISDTFANLGLYNPADYPIGTLFFATDWLVTYCVQLPTPTLVPTWLYYNGIYGDVLANIPGGLGVNDKNFTFNGTDYFHNWRWDGAAWHFTTGGTPAGLTLFSPSGPPFGGTGANWHLEDGSVQPLSQDDGTTAATALPTVANTYIAL